MAIAKAQDTLIATVPARTKKEKLKRDFKRYYPLYILFLPILVYFIIFRYTPIFLQFPLVFSQFRVNLGIWGSPWVGFDHFIRLFNSHDFMNVLSNTVVLFFLMLLFTFPPPIFLAILLHDMIARRAKRACQTVLFVPHFFSWAIVYGICWALFASSTGIINNIIREFGGVPINFFMSPTAFRPLIIGTALWKGLGWGTIIYLASLSSIDPQLYEAAMIDGAGPLQRVFRITLPMLRPIMVFVLTLSMGGLLSVGGEQVLLFLSPATFDVGDVLTTWIYRRGIVQTDFSFAAAAGLFQNIIGLILVLMANKASQRFAGLGLW